MGLGISNPSGSSGKMPEMCFESRFAEQKKRSAFHTFRSFFTNKKYGAIDLETVKLEGGKGRAGHGGGIALFLVMP